MFFKVQQTFIYAITRIIDICSIWNLHDKPPCVTHSYGKPCKRTGYGPISIQRTCHLHSERRVCRIALRLRSRLVQSLTLSLALPFRLVSCVFVRARLSDRPVAVSVAVGIAGPCAPVVVLCASGYLAKGASPASIRMDRVFVRCPFWWSVHRVRSEHRTTKYPCVCVRARLCVNVVCVCPQV